MPNFLNPLILFGLAAAAIPLLIHLFTRRRLKKVEFSSLLFLKDLEKTKIRQVKLKNLLLLLLRTLIVILIVLAFARPALKGQLAGLGKSAASSVVIIMDDSYSMAGQSSQGTLFEIVQKKGIEVLNNLTSQDEAAVIYTSAPPESLKFSRDFWSLKDTLSNRKPSYANAKFSAALEKAARLLSTSSNLNRELYIPASKSGSGWEKLAGLKVKLTIYLFNLSRDEIQNLSLPEIDFGQQLIELGRDFSLKVTVVNHTPRSVPDWLVGFYLDGKKVAQTGVKLKGESKAAVRFGYRVDRPGWHWGYFELAEDDLMPDNFRYFVLKIPDQIKILLAGEEPGHNRFLRLVLRPEEKLNINLQVKSVNPAGFEKEDLENYDLIILNDLKTISEPAMGKLTRFLETGGGLWVIVGNQAQTDFYNRQIAGRFFGIELKQRENQTTDQPGIYLLENWDLKHPVFSIYQGIKPQELPQIKFHSIHQAELKRKVKMLASFSGGSPALLEAAVEKGKAMLFLAGLDSASTDISLHPFFVPWVNRMVGYLTQDINASGESYSVGEVVQRELYELPAGQPIELIYPNQAKEVLTPVFTPRSALVRISDTNLPGIYQIKSGDKILDLFAVNLEAKESDPQGIDASEIKAALGTGNQNVSLVEVPADVDLVKFVQKTRYGRELWRETLIFALMLLGVEMWLGKTGSKTPLG